MRTGRIARAAIEDLAEGARGHIVVMKWVELFSSRRIINRATGRSRFVVLDLGAGEKRTGVTTGGNQVVVVEGT